MLFFTRTIKTAKDQKMITVDKIFHLVKTTFYLVFKNMLFSFENMFLAYVTRLNGGLGIHWNLFLCVNENYKFVFFCVREALAWPE